MVGGAVKTISEWQKEAHALAVEKGFHKGKDPFSPTRIGERLAQIHGEISEALECVKSGRMELYWGSKMSMPFDIEEGDSSEVIFSKGWKPEGFGIELADVFLRTCDFAESVNIQLDTPDLTTEWVTGTDPEVLACALNDLHTSLCAAEWVGPGQRVDGYALGHFLNDVFLLAESQGIDLLAMAELKHAYNRTRSIMHGGKKL
jgi:NTP pyrophosphatase (non-canonical NTP hydrolase)